MAAQPVHPWPDRKQLSDYVDRGDRICTLTHDSNRQYRGKHLGNPDGFGCYLDFRLGKEENEDGNESCGLTPKSISSEKR